MMSEFRSRWERLDLIRQEKFDIVLPKAMRENNVDMWIHAMKLGNPDPLFKDLGVGFALMSPQPYDGSSVYFIFTDRGGDRIERAVLGAEALHGMGGYDIVGDESELKSFVAERDPKRIAINMSGKFAVADSLSHTGYLRLLEALQPTYDDRLTSAELVISDFRGRRVVSEIVEFGKLGEVTRRLIERALSNEVIKPGVTTMEEVAWWIKDQILELGVEPIFERLFMPKVLYSAKADLEETESPQYVFQRGDLFQYDFGFELMNFGTDIKRTAYILPVGETAVPPGVQHAWDEGLRARQVLRDSIKVGRTAGETVRIMGENFESAGFVFVNLTGDPAFAGGWEEVWQQALDERGMRPEDMDKTQISSDCHCIGNTGDSEIEAGPSICGFRPGTADLTIKPNHLFAFELFADSAIPEWEGARVRFGIEDDAIVTEDGVQYLYPPNSRVLLIR
jgi:Xaa-Pro aminopeptidase